MVGCITDLMDMSLSKLWKIVKDREAWRAVVHGVTKSQTRPSNRTKLDALKIKTLSGFFIDTEKLILKFFKNANIF